MGENGGVWLTRTVCSNMEEARWDRDILGMVVGVLCRKNDDDPKVDGESLKSDVVVRVSEDTWQERSTCLCRSECESCVKTWNILGSRRGVRDASHSPQEP